ncbi:MAG TPA: hypothetical protein VKT82_04040 [Ktedonobacterales bacterium]|nr:hypothetical protein [Ktedonobacterales bacterium]
MSVLAASAASRTRQSSTEALLHGHWLLLARAIWLAIAGFCLVVWAIGIPLDYADLGKVCTVQPCDQDPTADSIARFHASGLSIEFYASYIGTIVVISSLLYLVIAALIFWRKSNTWIGLLTSLFLVSYGVAQSDGDDVIQHVPALAGPIGQLLPMGFICLALFLYLFPNGHFAPRWTRWVVLLWIPFFFVTSNVLPDGGFVPLLFVFLVISLYAQVHRYRRVSTPTQRQQTKWVVFGAAISILGFVGIIAVGQLLGLGNSPGTYPGLVGNTLIYVVQACLPLSLGIAILRSRLWDIDVIINKTLVYGSLTALLGALYAGLIIGLESLIGAVTNTANQPVALVISTLAIFALFTPVRSRIQAFIDRRFYRRKYDAEKTLAAFSAALRNEVDLTQLREHLLGVVQETMQPEHVSLWLHAPEAQRVEPPQQPGPHGSALAEPGKG